MLDILARCVAGATGIEAPPDVRIVPRPRNPPIFRPSALARAFLAADRAVQGAVAAYRLGRRQRTAIRELEGLSDWLLADIGLTRSAAGRQGADGGRDPGRGAGSGPAYP